MHEEYWRSDKARRIGKVFEATSKQEFAEQLPTKFYEYCSVELGWDERAIQSTAQDFWWHWHENDNATKTAKKNWFQTWQTWCKRSYVNKRMQKPVREEQGLVAALRQRYNK